MNISGHITRANLPSPLADLAINASPYWLLPGDTSDAADSASAGFTPGITQYKQVWADSPYVAGKQLVLSTPDNTDLALRFIVNGTSIADMTTKAAAIVTAVTQQLTYQVSLTYDTQTFTWNCYPGQCLPAYNQMAMFGGLLPLYFTCKRDPTPVSGPF